MKVKVDVVNAGEMESSAYFATTTVVEGKRDFVIKGLAC